MNFPNVGVEITQLVTVVAHVDVLKEILCCLEQLFLTWLVDMYDSLKVDCDDETLRIMKSISKCSSSNKVDVPSAHI